MSEELKPCPFCGGEDVEHLPDGFGNWLVGCVTCDYRIQCVSCTEDDAVRYWNTRPIEDEKDKQIAELKAELSRSADEGYVGFMLGIEQMKKKLDEKDKEIESLKVELDNLQHFCDSILEMAKRNNGVLYFKQDNGTWKIETGKDTDVPANPTDNNVGSIK